jgi:hypothetical protein
MPGKTALRQESPLVRFLVSRSDSRSSPGATFLFLAIAAFGFLMTRAATVELKYSALNPIRDPAVLERLITSPNPMQDERDLLTLGSPLAAETLYLPPTMVLRFMSLGHEVPWADLLFLRAHAYFLSHFFADRSFEWLDEYYRAVKGLDPDNPRLYLWAAQVLKLGQHINEDVINRSNRYLEEGIERFPRDWRLHMELGFNLYFELQGRDDAPRAADQLRARDHFAIAAGLPGAPIDPNFVAEIFSGDESGDLAIAYALQKYYEATEDQRKQLLRRIGVLSQALADGVRDEERRWRARYAFLPITLFALIDEQPAMTGTGGPRTNESKGAIQ